RCKQERARRQLRIAYLSYSPLRAGVANAVHVMNMCSAFSGNGHETALYARGVHSPRADEEIFSKYGVSDTFELRLRPSLRVKLLGRLYYGFRQALCARLISRAEVYYARCLVSAAFVLWL